MGSPAVFVPAVRLTGTPRARLETRVVVLASGMGVCCVRPCEWFYGRWPWSSRFRSSSISRRWRSTGATNRRQPRSARVRRRRAGGEAVEDENNAYVYLLGFSAPRDGDPASAGISRAAWIRKLRDDRSLAIDTDPGPEALPDIGQLYEPVRDLSCAIDGGAPCFDALNGARDTIEQATAEQSWLLDRYRLLLSYAEWADVNSGDFRSLYLRRLGVLQARRMYLSARLAARLERRRGGCAQRARCGPRALASVSARLEHRAQQDDGEGPLPRALSLGHVDPAAFAAACPRRGDTRLLASAAVGRGTLDGPSIPR